MKTRDMVLTALFTAIICIASPFSIPIGPIPLSLATFAIYITCYVLDWKHATLAVVLYVALGAIGMPVFTGFAGGFHKIAGVTGGYIIGYIPCAIVIGLMVRYLKGYRWAYILGMVIGTILLYTLGTAWFILQTGNTLSGAMAVCVVPFLPGDAAKVAVSAAIAPLIRKVLESGVSTARS